MQTSLGDRTSPVSLSPALTGRHKRGFRTQRDQEVQTEVNEERRIAEAIEEHQENENNQNG